MSNTNNKNQKGVSLYLTIVILTVLTSAILAMISISISQIKVIWTLGDSVIAFYGADSGIERVLYAVYKGGYVPSLGECHPDYRGYLGNNSIYYEVCVSETSTSTIYSTGTYKKTKRRIEINFY